MKEVHSKDFCVTVVIPDCTSIPDGTSSNPYGSIENEELVEIAMEINCPIYSHKFLIDILESEASKCPKFHSAHFAMRTVDNQYFTKSFIEKITKYGWKKIHVIGQSSRVSVFIDSLKQYPIANEIEISIKEVELEPC